MTPKSLSLYFIRQPYRPGWRAWLTVALVTGLAVFSATAYWRMTIALVPIMANSRKAMAPVEVSTPRLTTEEKMALRQEIAAVNRPIRQLNQSWDGLLADLRAFSDGSVRILGVSVDGRSGVVRVVGMAQSAAAMVDYAAYMADKRSLQDVVLTKHEQEQELGSGFRFTVEAKWAVMR